MYLGIARLELLFWKGYFPWSYILKAGFFSTDLKELT